MAEKFGHIKNPLTVIAIFAGLAEVSGTIMLPTMDKETQSTFVWYVMTFPFVLVLLFFAVLYRKHHVLYAPSDYQEDKSFKDIFEQGSAKEKSEKIAAEVQAESVAAEAVTDQTEKDGSTPGVYSLEHLQPSAIASRYLAEELVIDEVAREKGLRFERNVSLSSHPKIEFDALAVTSTSYIIIDVKFITPFTRIGVMDRLFANAATLQATLSANSPRKDIEVIVALIRGANVSEDTVTAMRNKLVDTAAKYPFSTTVHVFDYDALTSRINP